MAMAYRHAWELIDDMNQCFRQPVVETASGGRSGGGARLTPFGEELIERFHSMEAAVRSTIATDLAALDAEVGPSGRGTAPRRASRRRARPSSS
jgi:molybdate transport system regulatory protein